MRILAPWLVLLAGCLLIAILLVALKIPPKASGLLGAVLGFGWGWCVAELERRCVR